MANLETEGRRMARMVESGSTFESLGGIAAVVLTVVGLAHIDAQSMVAIAAIVLGSALLLQGGLVAAEYDEVLSRFEEGTYAEFGGGLGAEAVAGVTAIVLGILALFGVSALTLIAVAAIVLGAGLVLSSGLLLRLNAVRTDVAIGNGEGRYAAQAAVSGASYIQIFVGLVATVLGVLALVGVSPMTLTLVAMLGVGASILLSGGSMFGRMVSLSNQ